MRARVYARVYACMIEENRTPPEHDDRKKGGTLENLFIYVCLQAMKKKHKKKLKKFANMKNRRIFVVEIKQQTSLTIKIQSNENNKQHNFRKYPRKRIYD